MKCPLDQQALKHDDIEPGLPAYACPTCEGHWVRFGDYLTWRDQQPGEYPTTSGLTPSEPTPVIGGEPPKHGSVPRRCADCDYLLTRFRVGHGVSFYLDRCGNCNGVWLDQGEWAGLRARGLHDNIHEMFGTAWQQEIRTQEQRDATDNQFKRQLGDSYGRVREFGIWLRGNPRMSEVLAYLQWVVRSK